MRWTSVVGKRSKVSFSAFVCLVRRLVSQGKSDCFQRCRTPEWYPSSKWCGKGMRRSGNTRFGVEQHAWRILSRGSWC